MTDLEKVVKGLECCQYVSRSHCDECPFNYGGLCYTNDCIADLTSDALALLKEQPEIVRCRDCKHYMTIHCTCDGCCISDDWFCADGERLEDEDEDEL